MTTKWDETRRRCICGHELGRHTWNRARCLDRDCGCVRYRPDNRPAFTEHEMARCADCEHCRIEHRPICLATTKYAQNCDCLVFVEKTTPIPASPEGITPAEMMAWPEMQALSDAMLVAEEQSPDPDDRCSCGHDARDHRDRGTGTCTECERGRPGDDCWRFRPEIGTGPDDEREPEDPFDRPPRPPATREEFAAMAVQDALAKLGRVKEGDYDSIVALAALIADAITILHTAVNNLPDVSDRVPT